MSYCDGLTPAESLGLRLRLALVRSAPDRSCGRENSGGWSWWRSNVCLTMIRKQARPLGIHLVAIQLADMHFISILWWGGDVTPH